jgi:hypothetical protein
MRINEFVKTSKTSVKRPVIDTEALYESKPLDATITDEPIFNIDPNSELLKSHRRRNTLAYQKMKNWD